MKIKFIFALVLFSLSVLLIGHKRSFLAEEEAAKQRRVQFQIATVEEKSNQRNILSQTTIEGLAGTDFNINLQTGNFKMQARFLSDLIEPAAAAAGKLKIRAKLDTRRFYGYSPINLPLYEEDNQSHTLEIGFDETIVLLPFGRNGGGGGETLKIEITPTLLPDSNNADKSLKINLGKQIPSGELAVEAFKIPHRFEVEAALLADGQVVALGTSECLLQEEKEIRLLPSGKAGESGIINEPYVAKLTVDKFSRSRPQDFIGINFSFYRMKSQSAAGGVGGGAGESEPVISNGAGITTLGSEIIYRLDGGNLPKEKNYELRFKVRLGAGESEN